MSVQSVLFQSLITVYNINDYISVLRYLPVVFRNKEVSILKGNIYFHLEFCFQMVVPPRQKGQYPLFVVTEGTSSEMQSKEPPYRELGRLQIRHVRCDQDGNRIRAKTVDSDDFVIL